MQELQVHLNAETEALKELEATRTNREFDSRLHILRERKKGRELDLVVNVTDYLLPNPNIYKDMHNQPQFDLKKLQKKLQKKKPNI